jgi:hypothetical protein
MIFANGYANVRHIFEYIVFRYMIFINFSPNLLQLYTKTGIQTLKMVFIKCFDLQYLKFHLNKNPKSFCFIPNHQNFLKYTLL